MASACELLIEMLRHHYRWLTEATRGMDLEQARRALAPGRPSTAWLVAHLADDADSVLEAVVGAARSLPPDLAKRLSHPDLGLRSAAEWRALRSTWADLSERVLAGLGGLTDEDLERPPAVAILPAFRESLATRRAFLSGHAFHVAYHLGQLGSLRAELGLGWGAGGSSGA